MATYVDTSALVKLVVAEASTSALRRWLAAERRDPVASELARTELMRAVRRAAPQRAVRARAVLDGLMLVAVTPSILDQAGRIEPSSVRSLDAIHLATALALGDDLGVLVTYDERLGAAAEANGLAVASPR